MIKIPTCLLPFVRVLIMVLFFFDGGGFLSIFGLNHDIILLCVTYFQNYYPLCVMETKTAVQDPSFVLVK